MQKDQAYHEAAIAYNEGLAEYAENLVPTLGHEEVRKWCTAVGKQHRFHAKRHRSALNKILLKQKPEIVEALADGLDVQVPPDSDVVTVEGEAELTAVRQVEVEEILEPKSELKLDDGCVQFHNPSDPNCEFYPKES